ncbi:unnamed protein product [Schistosoma margrebowiei]|uniref:Uncharacterized protein n=1 Tax=Schistosoma margrebowiei TaxID=48269 RepID=A0A183LKT0_9TREM|nr:unnamed protein product [Schistosoma margrebowiei]
MNTSEQTVYRPFVTTDGKIWPANVFVPCKRYYCIKVSRLVFLLFLILFLLIEFFLNISNSSY